MSLWMLVWRSLVFYRRTNVAVLLAVAVGAAVLTGALAVGDSVRYSLSLSAEARLGRTQVALVQRNRFFRAALADELTTELGAAVAPVLAMRGLISDGAGERRVNMVDVLGVDERFFHLGPGDNPFRGDWGEGVVLSESLARGLAVGPGDEVVLRIDKPGVMPRDMPLVPDSERSVAFRLTVKAVAGDLAFGRFSLQANQVASPNVFVQIDWLGHKLDRVGQANMLLVAGDSRKAVTVGQADAAVRRCWQVADAGLDLRRLERQGVLELRSRRVFIEEVFTEAATRAGDDAAGVLTYFVNELRIGDKATPYSMVSAVGHQVGRGKIVPVDMQDDEIVINRWLADDLDAKIGDSLELKYFVLGPVRKLYEQKSTFRVRDILPMQDSALDPELMPDFPGLAEVDNCRDWQPGIPIRLDKIRPQDEEYWDKYRGTPKAFVTLRAGQAMWSNRYGNLTAVRYSWKEGLEQEVARRILSTLDPALAGFFFQSVRSGTPALAGVTDLPAGGQSTDFGQLFLGLSMFLIAAAVILTGLVFVFGVESRGEQVGTLLALGFSPSLVRTVLFLEGAMVGLLGTIVGVVGGLLYTRGMIYGLATIWRGAVAGSQIRFHAEPLTLFAGALGGLLAAGLAMWLTLRRQIRRPVRELLSGGLEQQLFVVRRRARDKFGILATVVSAVGAAALLVVAGSGGSRAVSGAFFGAGALLLISGLGANRTLMRTVGSGWSRPMVSLRGLALRNAARRTGRSLAVTGLLACGVFLVVAIGANRSDPLAGAEKRDSGTGGFALFCESAIAIVQDLNSLAGRESVGLGDDWPSGAETVHLRVHDGDDASCLNLNRVRRPKILGVRPEELQRRGAFGFTAVVDELGRRQGWNLLNRDLGENVAPVIGDYPTVFWALGKRLGDEIEYVDERGRAFRLRIVGMLKSSILQGSLIVAEDQLTARFPSEDGYRAFLVDAPDDKAELVGKRLSSALGDFGIVVTPARERLAAFSVVEDTYLSIFTMLGGLGLVLGSIGLGLVVLRNVLERRGELAMLRAVGFGLASVKRMVFYEHWGLMMLGLLCGVIAALVAVVPALRSPGGQVPYVSVVLTVVGVAVSGALWVWIAAASAVGGGMLSALRSE